MKFYNLGHKTFETDVSSLYGPCLVRSCKTMGDKEFPCHSKGKCIERNVAKPALTTV